MDEVESLGTVPTLCPPLGPHCWTKKGPEWGAEAFVGHINEWQARPNDFHSMRVPEGRVDVLGVGVSVRVTVLVSQRG